MTLTDEALHELAGRAESAARAAGRVIADHFGERPEVHHKARGTSAASQVVTTVDHRAQAAILAILQPTCAIYDLALLSEESADDGGRLERPAFWSIDPLDGTLAFIEGIPGFSVSIALLARDGTPLIGVIHDPREEILYRAVRGHGAYRNGAPIPPPRRTRAARWSSPPIAAFATTRGWSRPAPGCAGSPPNRASPAPRSTSASAR